MRHMTYIAAHIPNSTALHLRIDSVTMNYVPFPPVLSLAFI